jgi:hypothetical protein
MDFELVGLFTIFCHRSNFEAIELEYIFMEVKSQSICYT